MKREMGIARCGLACCLCSGNETCAGCNSGECPDRDWCENRNCSMEKGIEGCYVCDESCSKGLLGKIKPLGVLYHREGINGDYDDFEDVEALISFIQSGNKA